MADQSKCSDQSDQGSPFVRDRCPPNRFRVPVGLGFWLGGKWGVYWARTAGTATSPLHTGEAVLALVLVSLVLRCTGSGRPVFQSQPVGSLEERPGSPVRSEPCKLVSRNIPSTSMHATTNATPSANTLCRFLVPYPRNRNRLTHRKSGIPPIPLHSTGLPASGRQSVNPCLDTDALAFPRGTDGHGFQSLRISLGCFRGKRGNIPRHMCGDDAWYATIKWVFAVRPQYRSTPVA